MAQGKALENHAQGDRDSDADIHNGQSWLFPQGSQENDDKGNQEQRIPSVHLIHRCQHRGNIFRHHKVTAKAQPIYGIDDDGNNSGGDRGPQHGPNMSIQIGSRAQRGPYW